MSPTRKVLVTGAIGAVGAVGAVGAAAAIGAVALALLPGGLPAAAQQQRFGETTEVVAIEVPVQVVRDGEPVRGLTAADFEVRAGRRKLALTGFNVVDLAAVPAAAVPGAAPAPGATLPPPLPIAARRHFLLLFDLSYAEPSSIVKARLAARQVVETALHPSDLVAVGTFRASEGPRMVLGFTSDRRQAVTAINTLGLPQLLEQGPDPLRLTLQQERVETTGIAAEAMIEVLEALQDAERIAQQRTTLAFSRSMTHLAELVGGLEGRKYVLYLSEGFTLSAATGTADLQKIQEMNRAAETAPWQVDSDIRYGSTHTVNVLDRLFAELRRADCVVQTVDIGGLRADGSTTGTAAVTTSAEVRSGAGKSLLFALARETGGELYENFNDPKVAMGQMLRRTGVTYVLTVQPENLKLDGAYHDLDVKLKGQPRGTRVVHRPGFYAPKPFADQSPLVRLLDAGGLLLGGEESGTVQAAVLAVPFRAAHAADAAHASDTAGTGAFVPVLIEVDGPSLLAGLAGNVLPAEIYAYAFAESGAVEDFFTENVALDLAASGPVLRQRGLKFFGHLTLPPGRYAVRVLVRNVLTGAYALRAVALEVPSFTGGPVLLPPLFPEPAGRWLTKRDTRQPEDRQVAFPFVLGGKPFLPAARPVLQAGQSTGLVLTAYNLGSGEVQAEAVLLAAGAAGAREAGRAPLTLVREESIGGGGAEGGEGPDRLAATWAVPALPAGDYTLQISLNAGGVRRTSQLPVVIRGGVAGDG
jgi:VWFA-related protein